MGLIPFGQFQIHVKFINRPIQANCIAPVTYCGLGLETAKSFSKLFHITQKLRLVFQLNECVFPKDLTQYLSRYNPMIELTDLSDE